MSKSESTFIPGPYVFSTSSDTSDLLDRNRYSYSVDALASKDSGANSFSHQIKYNNYYLDSDDVATVLMNGGSIPLRSKSR